jgi:DNA-binding NarL/FixJ family response regulator
MQNTRYSQALTALVLSTDRLYADVLRRTVSSVSPHAQTHVAHSVEDALRLRQQNVIDLLVTGCDPAFEGDILQLIAEFTAPTSTHPCRVFVVGSHLEYRVITTLHTLPIRGVFDTATESPDRLEEALEQVLTGGSYWSTSVGLRVRHNPPTTRTGCEHLSMTEQLVLSVVGDGSDDMTAAQALGLSPATVSTIRQKLHRKLRVQHRGELIRVAAQNGYVRFTAAGIVRPGFSLLAAECLARKRKRRAVAEAAMAAFMAA